MPNVNCGLSSTILFTIGNDENSIVVSVGGSQYTINFWDSLTVPCSGIVSVVAPSYTLIPAPLSVIHNYHAFSFLWGLLAAFAFAVASIRRWF